MARYSKNIILSVLTLMLLGGSGLFFAASADVDTTPGLEPLSDFTYTSPDGNEISLIDITGGANTPGTAETKSKAVLIKVFETGRNILGSIAILALIYGAAKLAVATNEESLKGAREIIIDSVIAMVLVTAAPVIIDIFYQGGVATLSNPAVDSSQIGNQPIREFWRADLPTSLPGGLTASDLGDNTLGELALYTQIFRIIDLILLLLIPTMIGMIIYYGALHIFAGDKPDELKKDRKVMIYGLIGLVIVTMAKQMVSIFLGKYEAIYNGTLQKVASGYDDSVGNYLIQTNTVTTEGIGILNTLIYASGVVAMIMLIYTGYRLMLAGDNKDEYQKQKKQIMYIVIGLIVIISSYIIVKTVVTPSALIQLS